MSYKLTKEDQRILAEGDEFLKQKPVDFPKELGERWKKDAASLAEGIRRSMKRKK